MKNISLLLLLLQFFLQSFTLSFRTVLPCCHRMTRFSCTNTHNNCYENNCVDLVDVKDYQLLQRRDMFKKSISSMFLISMVTTTTTTSPVYAVESLSELRKQLQVALEQMDVIPGYIDKEQWDSVRAVLITPPLSDLWTKSSRKINLLQSYADAVGDNPNGDEFAILECKDELQSHLRYLDMAVYNNVFNPIKTMGETGATKQLIRSYYEDPINEYKASIKALKELINLGNL